MKEMKYPEFKGLLDKSVLQLSEGIGELEATLELWTIPLIKAHNSGILQIENSETEVLQLTEFSIAGTSGLNPQVVSMIHNSSRRIYSCTSTNLIWGGQVSGEMYAKAIELLERAEELLGDDIHAGYERERILSLVSLAEAERPELNEYLSAKGVASIK